MRFLVPDSATTNGLQRASLWLLCVALPWQLPALAQDLLRPAAGIYTCIDKHGNKHTGDRPIAACADRDQTILNPDGSIKGRRPPSETADERGEREVRERKQDEDRAAIADAGRRDRNLFKRYPNEASHQRAREVSLDPVRRAIRATEMRLRELAIERRPIDSEAEFYQGRPLPPKLKQQRDANDAAAEAQRSASANQEAELGRVTRSFDAELERLRRLWAGAAPGSMGPIVVPQAPMAAASTPRKAAPPH
jgi:hypothetical protein